MQKITQWIFLLSTILLANSAFAEIDLELSMTADKTNVAIYKNVTYTLTITNDGNETATGIGVEFPLPPNTAYTGSTTSKGSYVHWTNTWSINELAVGETATMDLVAFTLSNDVVRQTFAEVATVDQSDSDSTPNNNVVGFPVEDDEAELSVFYTSQTVGDLELSVVPNVSAYSTGDDVIYSLIMRNKGTTTTGPFRVQAYIPNTLNANRFGGNGFYDKFNQTWTFNYELQAGEATAMDIVGDALNMNQDLNSFFEIIAATNPDSDSTPNNDNGNFTADEDDEVFISLSPYTGPNESDLELELNINTYPATQTAEASFEAFVVLRNRGPANNKQINVDIMLPEEGIGNFEYSVPSHTSFNFVPNSTTKATWYNHFFANGEQDILLLTGTIEDETIPLTFYAEVRETPIPDPDSTPDNNSTQIPVEDDEAAFTIPPTNGTRPDLEALILEIAPISVQPGETIDLEFQVENVGGASAPASKVQIWLDDSYDGNPYHNDVIASLGTESIGALGIGEKETLNRTYTIPNDLPAGQYWVYIKADSDEEIEEDIEGNASVYFQKLRVGEMFANLYVRDVDILPSSLVAGSTVTLSCEVFSNGDIPASSSKLEYYFSTDSEISSDDVLIGGDYVSPLEVGEGSHQSITYDLPLDLESESYYFIFLANADQFFTEADYTDNKLASQRFVSGQQADLYFTETFIWGQSQVQDPNSGFALHSKVKNAGFVESPSTTLNYYISQDQQLDPSDILLGTGNVASIDEEGIVRATDYFDFPPNLAYGDYFILWNVNPDTSFPEVSYENNVAYARFTHIPPSNGIVEFEKYNGTGVGIGIEERENGYQILGMDYQNNPTQPFNIQVDFAGSQFAFAENSKISGKLIRTSNKGYIQVSSTSTSGTTSDIEVTLRNTAFGPIWTKTYNLGNSEQGLDIHETANGDFVITGSTQKKENFLFEGNEYERTLSDIVVLRIDADGNQLWFNQYEVPPAEDDTPLYFESGQLITEMTNGNLAVLTRRAIPNPSAPPGLSFNGSNLYVYIIGTSGELVEAPDFGYGNQQGTYYFPQVIKATSDGGYVYVTNWQTSSSKAGGNAEAIKVGGSKPNWTIKRSTSQFGTARFKNILENMDGNFIVSGIYQPYNSEPQYLLHVAPDGTEFDSFDTDFIALDLIQSSDMGYVLTGERNGQIYLQKIPGTDISEGVDIELEYTVDEPIYRQWQKVNYTLTATNTGTETATNLVISDPIPFGMAFTSKTASTGTYNLWQQTWTIPELASGETATLDLSLFTLLNNAQIVKFAQVKSLDQGDTDSTPNNNNTTIPQEDDETAVTITPINFGGGSGKDVLANPIAESNTLKLYNLFPVPADDYINLVFGTEGFQVNLFLYDVNGRLLKHKSLQVNRGENALQLEVSELAAGFYTISLETPEGFVRGKFLKK